MSWLANLTFRTSSILINPGFGSGSGDARRFAWSSPNLEAIPHARNLAQEPHPWRGGRRRCRSGAQRSRRRKRQRRHRPPAAHKPGGTGARRSPRHQARRDPDAGEPELRPLLRLAAGVCAASATRPTIQLPGGLPVWRQPSTAPGAAGYLDPVPVAAVRSGTFTGRQPPSLRAVGAQNYGGTDHSWEDQFGAWYGGLMNAWQYAKGGPTTLGFLDPPRHPVPLRPRRRLHDRRRLPLLGARRHRPQPHLAVVRARSTPSKQNGTFVAYSGGDELGDFLPWESYPETLQSAGPELEDLPGHRQLRRQRRAVLQDVRRAATRRKAAPPGARHQRLLRQRPGDRPRAVGPRELQRRQPGQRHQGRRHGRASCRRSAGWSPTSSTPSTRTARRPTAPTTSARSSRP